jgi:hypothetical protein
MMKSVRISGMLLVMLPLIFSISCSLFEKDEVAGGKGGVNIFITDAPFPVDMVESVYVTIERIDIRKKVTDCEDDDCSEFLSLPIGPVEVNILELRNGVAEWLGLSELEVGSYDMMRIFVSNPQITLTGGTSMPISIPGAEQSGLKIKFSKPLVVTDGDESAVMIDFNLNRSFVMQGNAKTPAGIKGFIFKPVIRAEVVSETGEIKGTVINAGDDPVEGAEVIVLSGDQEIATAITDTDGSFKIIALPAGTYDIFIGKEGYISEKIENINIVAGGKVKLGDIILEEE